MDNNDSIKLKTYKKIPFHSIFQRDDGESKESIMDSINTRRRARTIPLEDDYYRPNAPINLPDVLDNCFFRPIKKSCNKVAIFKSLSLDHVDNLNVPDTNIKKPKSVRPSSCNGDLIDAIISKTLDTSPSTVSFIAFEDDCAFRSISEYDDLSDVINSTATMHIYEDIFQ